MGATRAQLFCLQHCAQVNVPKPSAYGAVTSSRPELARVQWLREQESLPALPAPLRVGRMKPCPRENVVLRASLREETALRVGTLLDFKK